MKDTQETNLPLEETGKLEETKAPEVTPENTADEVVTNEAPEVEAETDETPSDEAVVAAGKLTKEEILEKLTGLVEAAADASRNEVESLKQAYYKIHRNEMDELKKEYLIKKLNSKQIYPSLTFSLTKYIYFSQQNLFIF